MPIFLLAYLINPAMVMAQYSDQEQMEILFALNDDSQLPKIVEQYGLSHVKNIFGNPNQGLPMTYSGSVSVNTYPSLVRESKLLYAEQNHKLQSSQLTVSQIVTPNDPFFTLDDKNEDRQWYLSKIKLPDAWAYGKGSADVRVAIVDTGIHASHLDLNDGRIVEGYDTTTSKAIPAYSNSDDNGHGTAVAGVIGAIPNNAKGIAGINWNISIVPVKALLADGTGTITSVAQAIVWAADHDVDIINLSLGGPGFGNDQTLNNSIIYAYGKGSLIVSAAGNDLADQGINLDTNPVYPICSDGGSNMVIGVAASDVNDRKASFSNFSINCVDIVAPGKKILTTAFIPSDPADNILIYGSGTSLATPVVSGVAALIKANNPTMTNTEIKNIILRTADNIDALNQNNCLGSSCNGFLGKGRINALSSLSPQPLLDGTLVRQSSTNLIYFISGGKKRLVSNFVLTQRGYSTGDVLSESGTQLSSLPTGIPLPPFEGTLIKSQTDPTVYVINQEVKRPLTFLVFQSRAYSFANVITMPDPDVISVPTGEWYWPPDGTMVLVKGNPTVFVMFEGVARPTTYFVFQQRRLSFAKVVAVSKDEFSHIPRPKDAFWLPPMEGTLIKPDSDPTVFVIEQGLRHPVSYEAFVARKYKFSDIKTLPVAEVLVIQLGSIYN